LPADEGVEGSSIVTEKIEGMKPRCVGWQKYYSERRFGILLVMGPFLKSGAADS
jgi:hypothetical protein